MRVSPSFCVVAPLFLLLATGCSRSDKDTGETAARDFVLQYAPLIEYDEQGKVTRLHIKGPEVDDQVMDQVVQFKILKKLGLQNSRVTDASMQRLQECKRLMNLDITGTLVTDKGLAHLQKVPSLQQIWASPGRS